MSGVLEQRGLGGKSVAVDNRQLRAMVGEVDPHLLIVWHSRTGAAEAMARAAFDGAGAGALLLPAQEVQPDHLLAAAGYLFSCPENLASMSGAMKEMFDRCYYPVLGLIEGRPYATAIAAGSDGTGAQRRSNGSLPGGACGGWRSR